MSLDDKSPASTADRERAAAEFMAVYIRERSRAGRLTSRAELKQALAGRGLLDPAAPEEDEPGFAGLAARGLRENEDLVELSSPRGGALFYSNPIMSHSYAELLRRKEGPPVLLLVETIRSDSAFQRRPTALDFFRRPPLELTDEELAACREQIHKQPEFEDIKFTRTRLGVGYFYSTLHLEPDLAILRADWQEESRYFNP
ncbi:MAG: hypothetical protein V1816_04635 [Pseudomonadota bacterium]